MNSDEVLREELLALLRGGNAHMNFDKAVSGFPMESINEQVPQGTYKVWHLLDHMRIVQWDISSSCATLVMSRLIFRTDIGPGPMRRLLSPNGRRSSRASKTILRPWRLSCGPED